MPSQKGKSNCGCGEINDFHFVDQHKGEGGKKSHCKKWGKLSTEKIETMCKEKFFIEYSGNPCPGRIEDADSTNRTKVDLIVLIDTSGSMQNKGNMLGQVAERAIEAAKEKCSTDLRVSWFGIEGEFPPTFNQTYRNYLKSLNPSLTDADFVAQTQPNPTNIHKEEGAGAIIDLSRHFDWRPDSCKAIFYLSDEPLKLGTPQNQDDTVAAQAAAAAANDASVSIFTHLSPTTQDSTIDPLTEADFRSLSEQTDGKAYVGWADEKEFAKMLSEIICSSCGAPCRSIEIPAVKPCFELKWGDGPNDRLETDDVEVLCITACNPYSNVSLSEVTLMFITVTNADGTPVATLPDGTNSVELHPQGHICFGDLSPCTDQSLSCVSRELVLITRGAKEGPYKIEFGFCYGIGMSFAVKDKFEVDLVYS